MTSPGSSRTRTFTARAFGALCAVTLAACSSGGGAASSTTNPTRAASTTSAAPPGTSSGSSTGPAQIVLGPERVPVPNGPALGPVKSDTYGQPIDSIECQTSEQVVYHIHAHVLVFVDGQPRQVPYGIGIGPPIQVTDTPVGSFVAGGSCFYWLHTHAADGIIHIESPNQKLYTLGQLFDLWGLPLATGQIGPATGNVTIFVDGQLFTGNPRDIELKAHGDVQLDVGTVVAPQRTDWSQASL